MPWQPTSVNRYEETIYGSSTRPAVVMTDQGRAYLKALNNPIGPPALVREWVGSKLAALFKLNTFDMAILRMDDIVEVPLGDGVYAVPGPAIVTRKVDGFSWGGGVDELDTLENPEDIPRLVVFDTWTRNRDRHPPVDMARHSNYDNVFFSEDGAAEGHLRLVAMDHTECFEPSSVNFSANFCTIDRVRDNRLYGLFDGFLEHMRRPHKKMLHQQCFLDSLNDMRHINRPDVEEIVREIPREWELDTSCRSALINLIMDRAHYLADRLHTSLGAEIWPGELLLRI